MASSSVVNVARQFGKRHIVQLRKVTIHYSPRGGSSEGTRRFISEELDEYSTARPSVVVATREIPDWRHPYLFAEYLNGRQFKVPLKNCDTDEVANQAFLVATNSGKKAKKVQQPVQTKNPTIQGNWNPFTNLSD